MSTKQESKKLMEGRGYLVGDVEQQIPHTFIKRDLFGLFDLVAIKYNETVGIQVTSRVNISARVKKIEESENLGVIRKAGWRILVQGWDKGKDKKWRVKEVDLS